MSEEAVVTDLLSALARLWAALVFKAAEIREQPEFSEVTHELTLSKTDPAKAAEVAVPGIVTDVIVTAYVNASVAGAHGVSWDLDLVRRGSGWEVEREVRLMANREADDVSADLPTVRLASSLELAERLQELTDEWLQMPVPGPSNEPPSSAPRLG